ncbi:RNA-binding protein [Rivularia sp. UHCC 0363]|uniref:RNA recognition motif domain-containing protein n=1 Tax=Rivularia sp. UHCC 0363 TaxID=3110244 RepID=UPI002B2018AF|nr:RNA-binding protein [Rivularia sp. UHCC 0363]MEA5598831.1 RNA-binding protein [Rivularia sp. UHCC 0363]
MSIRLYIGNLPKEEIDKSELQEVFAEEGSSITTKLIKDRKTGKCRGFGFMTVNNDEQADQIIEKYNGLMFKDSPIKLEKALPRSKNGEEGEEQPLSPQTSNTPAPTPVASGSSNVGGASKKAKKSRRGGGGSKDTSSVGVSSSSSDGGVHPDPRWAAELEKLKQMLAAQTTN